MLYHIVKPEYWALFADQDLYTPETFEQEGFIHLSTQEQVSGVLDRYYSGIRPLILLHLDETKFSFPLKYEPSMGNELFPHLYGSLNKDAIVTISEL
ncbi:MAG: DUF952 domain-containing protein [Siphonobacter sp.]